MKRLFFILCAAVLTLVGCEQEMPSYTYGDVFCYYSPELTVTEETPIANGVHVVFRKDNRNYLAVDIQDLSDELSAMSDKEILASIKQETDGMFEAVKNQAGFTPNTEPYYVETYPDRWSQIRKFESEWRYDGRNADGTCVGCVAIEILEGYKLKVRYEGSSVDEKDLFSMLYTSFRLKSKE